MPNPKLETYKNKATGTVYDYTDAAAQASIAAIEEKIPDVASSENQLVTEAGLNNVLNFKEDKVPGKGLSTNDYDNTEKAKVAGAFPRSEQAVLGAKQLLDISKAVYGSLTFSTSEQGRVVNFSYGTAAAWATVKCRFATKPNTNYRISAKATSVTGAVALKIQVPVSETNIKMSSFYTEPADFDFDFNSGNNSELELVLFGTNGTASVCNVTYEDLLITLGTDTDRSFAPFAMTNKELTEKAQNIDSINTVNTYNLTSSTSLNFNLPSKEGLTLFIVSGFAETRNGMYVCRNNAGNRILFPIKAQSDVTITIEQATGAVSVTSTANAVLTVMNFKS